MIRFMCAQALVETFLPISTIIENGMVKAEILNILIT